MTGSYNNNSLNFDSTKNYSLVHFQQGEDSSSKIVLLETELIETQEILRRQFAEAIKVISNGNKIWINEPTPISNVQLYTLKLQGINIWTELGFLSDYTTPDGILPSNLQLVGTQLTPVVTYACLELYETILSNVAEIIDPRVGQETARRRKLNARIRMSDTPITIPSNLSEEYNYVLVDLGIFNRTKTGVLETWDLTSLIFTNNIGNGNEVKLKDLRTDTIFTSNSDLIIRANAIDDKGGGEYEIVTLKIQDDTLQEYPDIKTLQIPAENITYNSLSGLMELNFPSTLEINEGGPTELINPSTTGVEKLKLPLGGYQIISNVAPKEVQLDPKQTEKRSLYNGLLSQGTNFLFSKYAGLFFIPEDFDTAENDLIDISNSTTENYNSNSNGCAYFDYSNSKRIFQSKGIILDASADLTAFMFLYDFDDLNTSSNITWQYATYNGTWSSFQALTPNVVIEPSSSISNIKIKATISSVAGHKGKLNSAAIFFAPINSPNILRSNTANWEESFTTSNSNAYTIPNGKFYSPNNTPSQIEVYAQYNGENGFKKLKRQAGGGLGTYEEYSATQLKINGISTSTQILVRPIASAIDTNASNAESISILQDKVNSITANYVRFFNGTNELGVGKQFSLKNSTDNLTFQSNLIGDKVSYNFGYSNSINSDGGGLFSNQTSNTEGSCDIFNTMAFYYPIGGPQLTSANSELTNATLGAAGIKIVKSGLSAGIKIQNTYYQGQTATTLNPIGIPSVINLMNAIEVSSSATNQLNIGLSYDANFGLTCPRNDLGTGNPNTLRIKLATNKGLEFSTGSLAIKAYDGLQTDANGLSVLLNNSTNSTYESGLGFSSGRLAVASSNGIATTATGGIVLDILFGSQNLLRSGSYYSTTGSMTETENLANIGVTKYIGTSDSTYSTYLIKGLICTNSATPEYIIPSIKFLATKTNAENIANIQDNLATFYEYDDAGVTKISCKINSNNLSFSAPWNIYSNSFTKSFSNTNYSTSLGLGAYIGFINTDMANIDSDLSEISTSLTDIDTALSNLDAMFTNITGTFANTTNFVITLLSFKQ